ncbi:hypothetical protein NDA17_000192 [Ustilago hordei]|nr:hypothetical protein NDA17_000192 [Ustilago hordei]
MTDPDLNNKLDRLLTLLEAQLELTRQVSFNLDVQEDINYEKRSALPLKYFKSQRRITGDKGGTRCSHQKDRHATSW